jgi:hypothetical protein
MACCKRVAALKTGPKSLADSAFFADGISNFNGNYEVTDIALGFRTIRPAFQRQTNTLYKVIKVSIGDDMSTPAHSVTYAAE